VFGVGSGLVNFTETASVNLDSSNQHTDFRFGSGGGPYRVYTAFSQSAYIDGYMMPVKVNYNFTQDITSIIDDIQTTTLLTGSYSGTASGSIVEVSFLPGSGMIVYDPTVGSGNPVQNPVGSNSNNYPNQTSSKTNSVTKIAFSILLGIVFLLF